MLTTLRNLFIAFVVTWLLIMLAAVPTHAQSWSSGFQSGLTEVESAFEDGVYTWTLINMSSLAGDPYPDYDILVWSLIPFQVTEPMAWEAPEGWEWTGNRWAMTASPSRKYYTPDSLGPGESVQFRYTPNPEGALVNASGPQPEGLSFLTHVGAVVPGSGTADGSVPWTPASTSLGNTWHDVPLLRHNADAVPEPAGLIIVLVGISSIAARIVCQVRRTPRA